MWGVEGGTEDRKGEQRTLSEGHSGFMVTLFHLASLPASHKKQQ